MDSHFTLDTPMRARLTLLACGSLLSFAGCGPQTPPTTPRTEPNPNKPISIGLPKPGEGTKPTEAGKPAESKAPDEKAPDKK
jgi:hypothetical protein